MKIQSGKKYQNYQGTYAIKDGMTNKKSYSVSLKKPYWLKTRALQISKLYYKTKSITKNNNLSTVCQEAKCPNINNCWSHGVATIMLMGSVCTRACKFCSVDTGNPRGLLDIYEPQRVAKSVNLMGLKYVVLTSVDRDDLEDGGASHYAKVINTVKSSVNGIKIEVLTPDFQGKHHSIDKILDTDIDVFAHNIETIERLTNMVRDPRASYHQTMYVLKYVKNRNPNLLTKTSMMLGLGETQKEILVVMDNLREIGVDILTLGQYMQPTKYHLPIKNFVNPLEFIKYKEIALKKGFLHVVSSPMSRSSYRADRIFNNI